MDFCDHSVYNPTTGLIKFNNNSIKDIPPRQYRRQLALVQQEPVLYQGTIRESISISLDTRAKQTQTEDACRDANIFDFVVSLPEGFATLCGARETQLSGRRRYRIAIARASIRQPRLLLLDGATSALDTESESHSGCA
jgi:ATP-binding cassette subfamily B (MDR/TAP) protein 1